MVLCRSTAALAPAEQIMWANGCGAVPVVAAKERIIGIIPDRDLAMAAHLQGVAVRDSRVSSAMAREVKTCTPRDTPATVQALMQHHRIRRVPVVDSQRRIVGMISLGDLAHAMASEQTLGGDGMTWIAIAHTLARVSEPRIPRWGRLGERM